MVLEILRETGKVKMMQIRERNFAFGYFVARYEKKGTARSLYVCMSPFNTTAVTNSVANFVADGINSVHALNINYLY